MSTLTAEQVTALHADGTEAGMTDQPAAPSLSAAFRDVIAGLAVGSPTFMEAAEAFTAAYRGAAYNRQAAFALNNQGLGTLLVALQERGHQPQIEQTGGFCMALSIPQQDGTVWIIAGEGEDFYYVGRYTEQAWAEGDMPMTMDDGTVEKPGVTTEHALDLIEYRRTGTPFTA